MKFQAIKNLQSKINITALNKVAPYYFLKSEKKCNGIS